MAARAMMVVGSASHVGKSWMATAICRHLRRRGLRVAPFKAQNMSLNSYPCANGGEIGRAQVAQAEACGLEPSTDMNPILLKPSSSAGCQVVVNGKVWRHLDSQDYQRHYDFLLQQVVAAYQRLARQYEFIVLEGAGAAAEINLRSRDLVNLPLAVRLGIPAFLVADIDRGGAFASVVGTYALLEPEEKRCLRSFSLNRFRGDVALFGGGRAMLEERVERPCLGVFPHCETISLDDEDSVSLDNPSSHARTGNGLKIAIIRLPHIANFTDFRQLPDAQYIANPTVEPPDCIILPGSKNTIADLLWLREQKLDRWILDSHARGTAVWGVCGGFQMLGRVIRDPEGVESTTSSTDGFGLLPIETTLLPEKTTRIVHAESPQSGVTFRAYEIHMGETKPAAGDKPFALVEGKPEGFLQNGILGTYLHGAFENPDLLSNLLADLARRRNKPPPERLAENSKEANYDRLADWFETHADLDRFEKLYLS